MLNIRPVWKADELKRFGELEEKYHYMGETHSGGDTLRLVIENGAPVAPVSRKEGETGKCEMPVGRRLLSEMDLTNALVCSDALHCRHETVRAVARSNGESLVQIKDNQKGLLRNARAVVRARFPVASKKNPPVQTNGRISQHKSKAHRLLNWQTREVFPVAPGDKASP